MSSWTIKIIFRGSGWHWSIKSHLVKFSVTQLNRFIWILLILPSLFSVLPDVLFEELFLPRSSASGVYTYLLLASPPSLHLVTLFTCYSAPLPLWKLHLETHPCWILTHLSLLVLGFWVLFTCSSSPLVPPRLETHLHLHSPPLPGTCKNHSLPRIIIHPYLPLSDLDTPPPTVHISLNIVIRLLQSVPPTCFVLTFSEILIEVSLSKTVDP